MISPITTVGDVTNGGLIGTSQLILEFAVVVVPVAITVGLRQVNVCVYMLADTFGAMVFCKIGTEMVVRQKLELSCTMTVHVPGTCVTVELFPPNITLGVTTPVNDGARNVYEQVAGGV